eukprot:12725760-Alexandrium_andersonii.AAC.1
MAWGVAPTGLLDLDRYRDARMEEHEKCARPLPWRSFRRCRYVAAHGAVSYTHLRAHETSAHL